VKRFDLSEPPRRSSGDNLLPMINVVFLLLIFFLISAQLTAPEPFVVDPPEASSVEPVDGVWTAYLSADGEFGYREARGDEVLALLETERRDHCAAVDCQSEPPILVLRADGVVPASRLARLMPHLGALGFAEVRLVTVVQ
jgi:biopolymer transport protein ExbD